jgi:hypothetical protein
VRFIPLQEGRRFAAGKGGGFAAVKAATTSP